MARRSSSFRSRASRASRSTTAPPGSRIRTGWSWRSDTSSPPGPGVPGREDYRTDRRSPPTIEARPTRRPGPPRLGVEDLGDPVAPAPLHHAHPHPVEDPVQEDVAMGGALQHHPVYPTQGGGASHVLPEELPAPGGEPARQARVVEQQPLLSHVSAVPAGYAGQPLGQAEGPDPSRRAAGVDHFEDPLLLGGGPGSAPQAGRHQEGCGDAQDEGGPAPPPHEAWWPGRQTGRRITKRAGQMQIPWWRRSGRGPPGYRACPWTHRRRTRLTRAMRSSASRSAAWDGVIRSSWARWKTSRSV